MKISASKIKKGMTIQLTIIPGDHINAGISSPFKKLQPMKYKLNQKVSRLELTKLLCKEEIDSGLITSEKPLMEVSIIDGRFIGYTEKKWRIQWIDDGCKFGIIKPTTYSETDEETIIIDTSEYDED